MEKLKQKVRQTIKEHHMLQPGDPVIIALSGGADSVCLLSLLADMREEFGLKLRSLHVHLAFTYSTGVAVTSQVLCTSITLNKGYYELFNCKS